MTIRLIARRGMTLAEVMVALVLIGIVGAMFTKMLVAQGRFFNEQYGQRSARTVARAPMNFLLTELRMVQDQGGVADAQADGKRVRLKVPFRFGVVCGTAGGATVVSMLPVDSTVSATYAGWAWRATNGSYTEVVASAPLGADSLRDVTGLAGEATCTAARIHKPVVTVAGRQTFTTRQTSPCVKPLAAASPGIAFCTQSGPNAVAWRTPCQGFTGCGARQRRSPIGGAA